MDLAKWMWRGPELQPPGPAPQPHCELGRPDHRHLCGPDPRPPFLGAPQPLADSPCHPPGPEAGLGTAGHLHAPPPPSPRRSQVFIEHLLGASLGALGAGGECRALNLKLTWRAHGSWGSEASRLLAPGPMGPSLPRYSHPFPGWTSLSSNPWKTEAQGQLTPRGPQRAAVPSAVTATETLPRCPGSTTWGGGGVSVGRCLGQEGGAGPFPGPWVAPGGHGAW